MISLFQADNRINVTQNRLFTINELERSGSRAFYEKDPIFITIERKSAKLVIYKFMAIREKKVVFNQSVLVGRAIDNYDRRISDKVFYEKGLLSEKKNRIFL